MKLQGYPKKHRITGNKNISLLFSGGQYFFGKNIKAVAGLSKTAKSEIQFGISVPKKKVGKAYKRILIKRRIKESIRVQKNSFLESTDKDEDCLQIFFIWQSEKVESYQLIFEETKTIFSKIMNSKHSVPLI